MAKKSTDLSKDIPADINHYKKSFVAATKETITELQNEHRISNRQLAIGGKVAPSTMTDILTHDAMPAMNTMVGIIRGGFGMKLSDFFTIVEAKTEPAPDGSRSSVLPILIETERELPEEYLENLLGKAMTYKSQLKGGEAIPADAGKKQTAPAAGTAGR